MAKPSILSTIMRVESGGRNVPQSLGTRDVNNNYGRGGGDPAQGFYQITGGTWRDFGGGKTEFKSAIDAPYPVQLQIAQNIPVARWGPATQEALKSAGYEPQPGETLGQMLARYNEDPTVTRPEDVGGSSAGGTSAPAPAPPAGGFDQNIIAGLLAKQQEQAAVTAKAAALAEQANEQRVMQAMTKQGLGLLSSAETPAPQMAMQAPAVHRPQVQPLALGGTPDFATMLAQQRLMRRA